TLAPATTAPAESTTVPVICPVVVCPFAIGIRANKKIATANETFFMDGPLAKFKRFKNLAVQRALVSTPSLKKVYTNLRFVKRYPHKFSYAVDIFPLFLRSVNQ